MGDGYRSRKFALALFFTVASTGLVAWGRIGGGEYVAIVGLVLGLYGAANVAEKRGE